MRNVDAIVGGALISLLAFLSTAAADDSTPLLYNPSTVQSNSEITVPLVGLRPQVYLTNIFISGEGHGKGFYVPEYVIEEAVRASPKAMQAFERWGAGDSDSQLALLQSGSLTDILYSFTKRWHRFFGNNVDDGQFGRRDPIL